MPDVPSDVLREILIRVRADSLFRLTTVCKAWNRIITDPSFIRSHNQLRSSNCSAPTLLVHSFVNRLYSLSLDSLNYAADGLQTIDATPIEPINRPRVFNPSSYLHMASCNGLILLCNHGNYSNWVIWNPLTQEFHELPKPNIGLLLGANWSAKARLCNGGFGYDHAADDYKVVRIAIMLHRVGVIASLKFLVYSLRSGCWRVVSKDCPFDFCPSSSNGVFLHSALHWRSLDNMMIMALDVATEDYCQLSGPSVPIPAKPMLFLEDLSVAGGCLILSRYDHEGKRFDGWMMKDYGVEESWMKLFSIEEPDILAHAQSLRPVVYSKSTRQLILQCEKGLFWFDLENNIVKKVTFHDFSRSYCYQFWMGSLSRLDGNGGGVMTKTTKGVEKKRLQEADTRLTFCVRNICVQPCSDNIHCRSDYSYRSLCAVFDDMVDFVTTE